MEVNNNKPQIHINAIIKTDKASQEKAVKTAAQYEQKDYFNAKDPMDIIGRSQVSFKGRPKNVLPKIPNGLELTAEELKPIKLTETQRISIAKGIEFLKLLGFSDDEIAQIDLNDEKTAMNLSYLYNYFKTLKPEEQESAIQETSNSSFEQKLELINQELDEKFKYVNPENSKLLEKYIDMESATPDTIMEHIIGCNEDYKPLIMEKLPLLAYVNGKLTANHTRYLNLSRKEAFEAITKERCDIIKTINEILPEKNRISAMQCGNLGNDEDLTDEKVQEFIALIKNLSDNNHIDIRTMLPNYRNLTLKELTKTLKNLDDTLKNHPMNLENTTENGLDIEELNSLFQRQDMTDVQNYINSLSKDAKLNGLRKIPAKESAMPNDKMAELCNTLYDKEYGEFDEESIFKFIDKQSENNYKNIDDIITLVKLHKGTEILYTRQPERFLEAKNGDYKNLIEAHKKRKELAETVKTMPNYVFYEVVNNENIDLKEFNKILEFLKEHKVDNWKYYQASDVYRDANCYKKLYMQQLLNEKDFSSKWINEGFNDLIVDETLSDEDQMEYALELFMQKEKYQDYRFNHNFEKIKKIMQTYKQDKDATKAILELKKGDDYLVNNADLVSDAIKYYRTNPDLTKELLMTRRIHDKEDFDTAISACDIDKDYFLDLITRKLLPHHSISLENAKILVESSQVDKDYTERLINETEVNSCNREHYRFPKAENVKFITEQRAKNKEFVDLLVYAKVKDHNDELKNRFDYNEIQTILENVKDNAKDIKDLIDQKSKYGDWPEYSSSNIADLTVAMGIDKELTKELMTQKETETSSANRFYPSEIKQLVEVAHIDIDYFKDLLYEKDEDFIEKAYFKHNTNTITSVMNAVKNYGKKDVKELLKMKQRVGQRSTNRFHEADINSVLLTKAKNPKLFDRLLNTYEEPENDTDLGPVPTYNISELNKIIENCNEENSEYVDHLLNKTYKNKDGYTYHTLTGSDVAVLSKVPKEQRADVEELIDLIKSRTQKTGARVDSYYYTNLLHYLKTNKPMLNQLMQTTVQGKDGNYYSTYEASGICNILEKAEENKELVDLLLKDKTVDKQTNKQTKKYLVFLPMKFTGSQIR